MWDFILDCVRALRNWVVDMIVAVVDWFEHVIGWFKKLKLKKDRHIPFIVDAKRLSSQLQNAPRIPDSGVFEAVLDEQEGEITAHNTIQANRLDRKTRGALDQSEDGLVVLD